MLIHYCSRWTTSRPRPSASELTLSNHVSSGRTSQEMAPETRLVICGACTCAIISDVAEQTLKQPYKLSYSSIVFWHLLSIVTIFPSRTEENLMDGLSEEHSVDTIDACHDLYLCHRNSVWNAFERCELHDSTLSPHLRITLSFPTSFVDNGHVS